MLTTRTKKKSKNRTRPWQVPTLLIWKQNLKWVLGFNKEIDQGVHFLTSESRTEIFYTSSHTGVVYNYEKKTQRLLQGHCNQITATACSDDKRWLVTADTGEDSMLVVWDSLHGVPVRTYVDPHPNGVLCMDLSSDNQFIVTIGAEKDHQTISLWDWTNVNETGPIVSMQIKPTLASGNQMHWAKFNPDKNQEIAINSTGRIFFLSWKPGVSKFEYYSPAVPNEKMNYTKTVFIPNSEVAVTGTDRGQIYVFDRSLIIEGIGEQDQKRLIKVVKLSQDVSIKQLMTIDNKYLVVGNDDGTIRFYNFQFQVAAWFEGLSLNQVKSISFSLLPPEYANQEDQQQRDDSKDPFACREFIVADNNALVMKLRSSIFEAIDSSKDKSQTLMYGLKSSIAAIAVHPKKTQLAIAGAEGFLILWDYVKKGDPIMYQFEKYTKDIDSGKGDEVRKVFTCMEFTPDGTEILIGTDTGVIEIVDSLTCKFKEMTQQVKASYDKHPSIKQLIVSPDGQYFATSDDRLGVALFKKNNAEWEFNGKIKSHDIEITGICFGQSLDENNNNQIRLFSIGADRRCFEYDVQKSKYAGSLPVMEAFTIEQEAKPTSVIWYPTIDFQEGLILTCNDEYKMKLWNPKLTNSRRTALGPTYGGEISKLKLLNQNDDTREKFLLYSTNKKVIGLIKLPMDGNPNKTMGLIAHPDEVSDIACSPDGKYVFTCGGKDLAVNMWAVNTSPIDLAIRMGGEGIEPFINLIEGGREGQTFQDMNDFFYYSIIRANKENTTKTRKLSNKQVPVTELPNLMRAMGYYPTQLEVKNIIDEVKFSSFKVQAMPTTHVGLDTFIKLFVNHRPVYGIGKNNIQEAFSQLIKDIGSTTDSISRSEFVSLLAEGTEGIQMQELEKDLLLLIGEQNIQVGLPQDITADQFAENTLGFEEVDEEQLLAEAEASMQQSAH